MRGRWAVLALALTCGANAATEDVVQSVDRPFGRKPSPPAMAAPASDKPATLAAPISDKTANGLTPVSDKPANLTQPVGRPAQWQRWSVPMTDGTVERAFERWARERRMTLRWLVGRDLPVDAGAETVVPDANDFEAAARAGSSDPELVAAMMKVARAYWKSKSPFILREYDNAMLVLPKSEARP